MVSSMRRPQHFLRLGALGCALVLASACSTATSGQGFPSGPTSGTTIVDYVAPNAARMRALVDSYFRAVQAADITTAQALICSGRSEWRDASQALADHLVSVTIVNIDESSEIGGKTIANLTLVTRDANGQHSVTRTISGFTGSDGHSCLE